MAYELAKAYVQIIPSTKGIEGNLTSALGGAGDSAGKSAGGKFTSAFGGALKTIGAVAGTALIGAGAGITAFTKASVEAGKEFDSAMSQVQATMLKTADEMENEVGTAMITTNDGIKNFSGNLRDFAKFLGANTAFSATQAAEALNYMALAGYSTQESMDMLPNVLNLAAAGNMDLARASDMVTDTQTAFGLSAERTTQMVDEMAKAASTGNTNVEQLGDAFLTIGGLAQELNGGMITLADGTQAPLDNVQELEVALTAMANAGIKGSEAGTHMRNMLLKLSSPTADGTEQLEALGVSVFDAEGNMRSLKDILGDLNGSLSTLTQQEKLNAISDLFNARDTASAEALLNAIGEDWDEIGEAILDAAGAGAEMANIQLDNLSGDITIMQSAFEGLKIAISDGATPALREGVQGITGIIDGLHDLVEGSEEGGPKIKAGFEQLVGGIVDGIPQILTIFDSIADGLVDIFPKLLSTISSELPGMFENVLGMIEGLLPNLLELLPELVTTVIELIASLAGHLTDIIMPILNSLPEIIGQIMDGLIDNLPAIIAGLVELVANIVMELPVILAEITIAIVKNIPDMFAAIGEGVLTGIANVFNLAANWIVDYGAEEIAQAAEELAGNLDSIETSTRNVAKETANLSLEGEKELQYYQKLYEQLDGMVDENGKVHATNQELVNQLTGELSEALNTEITMQDGVIENWENEKAAIEELMETKRMQMLLDQEAAQAAQAAEAEAELYDVLAEANKNLSSTQAAREDIENRMTELVEGRTQLWPWEVLEVHNMAKEYEELGKAEEELTATRDQATSDLQKAISTQTQYEKEYSAFLEGNYADMSDTYLDFIMTAKSGAQGYGEALEEQEAAAKEKLNALKEIYKQTGDETLESQIVAQSKLVDETSTANQEFKNRILDDLGSMGVELRQKGEEVGTHGADGFIEGFADTNRIKFQTNATMQTAIDAAKETLDEHSPSAVFKEIGDYAIEGFINGADHKESAVISAFSSIADTAYNSANARTDEFYSIGSHMGDGIAEGMNSKLERIASSAARLVSTAINRAKSTADIKSPSRKMRREVGEMLSAGLALGIEDGEHYVLEAIDSMNGDMMADMAKLDLGQAAFMPQSMQEQIDIADRMRAQAIAQARMGLSGMDGGSGNNNIYITSSVTGAENPEEYARRLVNEIKMEMRMA